MPPFLCYGTVCPCTTSISAQAQAQAHTTICMSHPSFTFVMMTAHIGKVVGICQQPSGRTCDRCLVRPCRSHQQWRGGQRGMDSADKFPVGAVPPSLPTTTTSHSSSTTLQY